MIVFWMVHVKTPLIAFGWSMSVLSGGSPTGTGTGDRGIDLSIVSL